MAKTPHGIHVDKTIAFIAFKRDGHALEDPRTLAPPPIAQCLVFTSASPPRCAISTTHTSKWDRARPSSSPQRDIPRDARNANMASLMSNAGVRDVIERITDRSIWENEL
ncbi:Meiotic Sister-Chromatid recombination aldehyde dehydrogenase [Pseudogymnoascus australis]